MNTYFCFLLSSFLLLVGCTTPEDIAFKTTATVQITAKAAMSEWLDYKNTHTVDPAQIAKVKAAWDKYYAASQVEKDAVIAFKTSSNTNALVMAVAAVASSESDIVGLVLQFLPPALATKLKLGP